MESFFRAVRNEFELNQHFEEDLLDQVTPVYSLNNSVRAKKIGKALQGAAATHGQGSVDLKVRIPPPLEVSVVSQSLFCQNPAHELLPHLVFE